MEWLKAVISAVRRVRSELNVAPSRQVPLRLQAGLEQDRVRLKPANPTMKPWTEPTANVRVQGKVIAVIRQL